MPIVPENHMTITHNESRECGNTYNRLPSATTQRDPPTHLHGHYPPQGAG